MTVKTTSSKTSDSYQPSEIEKKWQREWERQGIYKALADKPNKYYLLVELTYTSGDLHIGHWFSWSAPDAFARFKRMQGHNVLFPVGGFDAFGLPAEDAAIKRGIHPKEWTYKNVENMRQQFKTMGPSFDWDKEVVTSDPKYYRWTQWIFLRLFEAGLAYKANVVSNWCPDCKTVLANEHVENGCCWRHTSTKVIQKEVPQWLFAITKYANRLIWPENSSVDWPPEIKEGQNKWIGKSQGLEIAFRVKGLSEKLSVFTTRSDTIFGATFIVLAPEHPLVAKLVSDENQVKVSKYIKTTQEKMQLERLQNVKTKSGEFTGAYAINPLNGEEIPIWVADFVLMDYGSGAVMGVPAHDQRDFDFAQKFNLPIKRVVASPKDSSRAYSGEGKLVYSGQYTGLNSLEAVTKISSDLIEKGIAREKVQYHLRDWSISRQRYWGPPIPIIYCAECGVVPVPDKDLPVVLPEKVDYTPTGKSPLATAEDWVNVKCPNCGGEAKRDTETMDTYVDSSWYFYRYFDPQYDRGPISPKTLDWLPIKVYFGGPEHILGHTLYARFITKVLQDLKLAPKFEEFAQVRKNHGIILGPDGYRMSKSQGNVVNPDEQVAKFGADAVRLYMCFIGPHDKGGTWKLSGIEGMARFLKRVWQLETQPPQANDSAVIESITNKTIKKVTGDLESYKFNTAIAAIMELVNALQAEGVTDESLDNLLLLLAPFAPHITEELWNKRQHKTSIHIHKWPVFDPQVFTDSKVTLVVQVNGKVRDRLEVEAIQASDQTQIEQLALASDKVKNNLKSSKYRTIFVPGRLINFVT